MLIHNAEVTGSLTLNNVPYNSGSFSGSFRGDGSQLTGVTGATTASYVEYSNVGNKPTLVSGSSQITYIGLSGIPSGIVSGSEQVSFNGIVDKPTLVSGSSQITYSGLTGIPSGIVSGSSQVSYTGLSNIPSGIVSSSTQITEYNIFPTTGSNTFQGNQTITGSLFVSQNLVVAGSSSIQYISSSVVDIADNIITVNAFNPGVRFGGLAVADSGSSPRVSGSILFDSIKDQWIFVHEQPTITSSVVLMGPETYNDLGNETYLSANRLPKGSGIEHLRDSNITDTGTVVSVNSNTQVTGSFTVVTGSAVELQVTNTGVNIGSALTDNHIISGSLTINPNGLFVSGSGNVGIGTISPTAYTGYTTLHIGSASSRGLLKLGNAASLDGPEITTTTSSDIYFNTNGTSTRMVISGTNGNVGIGTTSPAIYSGWGGVDVRGTNGGHVIVANTGGTNRGEILTDGNGFNVNAQTNNALLLKTNDTERMRITAGGNVGIGTTTPQSKLEVVDGTGSVFRAITNGTNIMEIGNYKAGGAGYQQLDIVSAILTFGTGTAGGGSATERMRITSGGNVGIGTTSPATQLNVGHENHGIGFAYLGASSLPSIAGIFTSDGTAGGQTGYGSLLLKARSDFAPFYSINFFTATSANTPVERMRITAGGNIGIGTTSPSELLDIRGVNRDQTSGQFNQVIYSTSSQDIDRGGSIGLGGFYTGTSLATTFGAIKGLKENGFGDNTAGVLGFYTRPNGGAMTERMRITSAGNITTAGSITINSRTVFTTAALYDNASAGNNVGIGFGPNSVLPLTGDGSTSNGTKDLGSSSVRWATVFTSDLSLSNGIGDYTIVEGENDLFLYNNKQNKVYKFVIEEVDPSTATPKKS